jgi:hypothetical protein
MIRQKKHKRRLLKKLVWICVILLAVLVIGVLGFIGYFKWLSRPLPAHYDTDYMKTHKDTVQIEIPEVYELANIAIAITDYGLENPNAVRKKGEYYERVKNHFLSHRSHPLISKIEFSGKQLFSRYYGFRENSARYRFDRDRIVLSGIYPTRWSWFPDIFSDHLNLVEDFARATRFREFYRDNQSFYEEQIKRYREVVPVKRMWGWLENQFPERYDSCKVIFSPLIGGSHSTQHCAGEDFREMIMFVSGPSFSLDVADEVREGLLSRVVFTEMDHNYVNPRTWDFWYQMGAAFHRMKRWNRQSGYRNPPATFNEYMTWAVFLLYADDVYEKPAFSEIRCITTDIMVKRRKFIGFEEFSEKLLQLYHNRDEGQRIPDLYPGILAWAEKVQYQTPGSQIGKEKAEPSTSPDSVPAGHPADER